MRAVCHCMAVRFEVDWAPPTVLDCNCSICRRYGALWAYYLNGGLRLTSPAEATFAYLWNERTLAFHHCKTCGCATHLQAVDKPDRPILGINARLVVGLDPATTAVQQIDNGHTGVFWTRSSRAPVPGLHPRMADPEVWLPQGS